MTSMESDGKSRPSGGPPEPLISLREQELLELALWIEVRGVEFYRAAAENIDDPVLHDLFVKFHGMEMKHEDELRAQLKPRSQGPAVTDDDLPPRHEYMAHLKTMSEKRIFPDTFDFLMEDLEDFSSADQALEFAKDIEDLTMRLFEFLRDFQVSEETRALAERLAKEEMEHIEEIKTMKPST